MYVFLFDVLQTIASWFTPPSITNVTAVRWAAAVCVRSAGGGEVAPESPQPDEVSYGGTVC